MKILIVLSILFGNAVALAGGLEPVVTVSSPTLKAGQSGELLVYWHNASAEAVQVNLPLKVVCRLKTAQQQIEMTARSEQIGADAAVRIEAKGFVKRLYVFVVPRSIFGVATLEAEKIGAAPLLVAVEDGRPPAADEPEAAGGQKAEPQKYESLDSMFALYQPYLGNFGAYEPMYFLVGTDPQDSRFQISFKYRMFNPQGPLALEYPWVKGFHFAYTQTSFWDLSSSSMPFEDTSYKPELFFLSSNIDTGSKSTRRFFLQTGFQHESNGRGGEASRSTNYLYAKPILIFYNERNKLGLQIAPKVWAYVANEESSNPDLADYRGYFDLELKVGQGDSLVLGTNFRWAEAGGSLQLDLTYPLRRILFGNIDVYLQAQYVNSLAESLINYKERNEALRFGLAIVR